MKKNKILFVCRNMVVGGIESASLEFINQLHKDIDIDVMMFNKCGKLLNKLTTEVKVFEGGKILKLIYRDVEKNEGTATKSQKAKKSLLSILKKLGVRKILINLALIGQKMKTKYDAVVCIDARDKLCAKFALEKVDAKLKFGFVHNDLSKMNNTKQEIKLLSKFDKIFCVSKSCAEVAKKVIPSLKDKIDYMYNFEKETIIKDSQEFEVSYKNDCTNVVSVSRLSKEKAFLRSLEVFKKLKAEGFNFVWHIIGGGDQFESISKFISQNEMQNHVKLYNSQANPYPYIKSADIFYLGSYHEAAPTVYSEAKLLGVPIVTTNTCSAKEFVEGYGIICDNNEEGIYNTFKDIFNNDISLDEIKNNLKNYKNKNKETKEKFLKNFH